MPEDKRGKSGAQGREMLPCTHDPSKAESAAIFCAEWEKVKADSDYQRLMQKYKAKYG